MENENTPPVQGYALHSPDAMTLGKQQASVKLKSTPTLDELAHVVAHENVGDADNPNGLTVPGFAWTAFQHDGHIELHQETLLFWTKARGYIQAISTHEIYGWVKVGSDTTAHLFNTPKEALEYQFAWREAPAGSYDVEVNYAPFAEITPEKVECYKALWVEQLRIAEAAKTAKKEQWTWEVAAKPVEAPAAKAEQANG
jgi:hypothetical protein